MVGEMRQLSRRKALQSENYIELANKFASGGESVEGGAGGGGGGDGAGRGGDSFSQA